MGGITSLVPLVTELYLMWDFARGAVRDAVIAFPFMVALAASVWWLLIERRQKLQYHRGVVYLASVIILWIVALGIVDLVRENGVHLWRANIAGQSGAIVFLLSFGLFFLTPFLLAGGVVLVFVRRHFDDEYRILPGT